MSLPAKRGRPILPKVRTKTASVMMVVDGCGNPLVKIELFHLFFLHRAQNGPKFRREESPDLSEKTEQERARRSA